MSVNMLKRQGDGRVARQFGRIPESVGLVFEFAEVVMLVCTIVVF